MTRKPATLAGMSVIVLAICIHPSAPILAQTAEHLKPGTLAPRITCRTLGGLDLDDRALIGRVTILLFGEVHNDRSVNAARQVQELLAVPEIAALHTQGWWIISRDADAVEISRSVQDAGVTLPPAQDPGRATFARYGIRVLPTVVVVDAEGRLVWARAGFPLDFRRSLEAACRLAAGAISREQFETLIAPRQVSPDAPEVGRAEALTRMGRRLLELGKDALAADKFLEARGLAPGYVPAHVGLAQCYLAQGRLADAEQELLEVRARNPNDVDANIGYAAIALARGGAEIQTAERVLIALSAAHERRAEVHFMLGRVYEAQKRSEDAMRSYKRAAQLWRSQSLEPTP